MKKNLPGRGLTKVEKSCVIGLRKRESILVSSRNSISGNRTSDK